MHRYTIIFLVTAFAVAFIVGAISILNIQKLSVAKDTDQQIGMTQTEACSYAPSKEACLYALSSFRPIKVVTNPYSYPYPSSLIIASERGWDGVDDYHCGGFYLQPCYFFLEVNREQTNSFEPRYIGKSGRHDTGVLGTDSNIFFTSTSTVELNGRDGDAGVGGDYRTRLDLKTGKIILLESVETLIDGDTMTITTTTYDGVHPEGISTSEKRPYVDIWK